MTTPLRIGERIEISNGDHTVAYEVVTYRRDGSRQIVTAKDGDGALHTVVVDLARLPGQVGQVVVGPVAIDVARALALDVLGGHRTRLPVSEEANILAAAVVALTGGAEGRAA